jgi:hypothetical protein
MQKTRNRLSAIVLAAILAAGLLPAMALPAAAFSASFRLTDTGTTWVSTTAYTFPDSFVTSRELIVHALNAAGLAHEGAENNYISGVRLPDGTWLRGADRGPNSGWMFYVNGEFPPVGIADYVLRNGDAVVLYYTNDWMLEPNFPDEGLPPFGDVDEDAWYYEAVKFVYSRGLMVGNGNGGFMPYTPLSRAMLVQILYNLEGRPSVTGNGAFDDVKEGRWYTDAISWARADGIIAGYGKFGPNDGVTSEQLAIILGNYARQRGRNDFEAVIEDNVINRALAAVIFKRLVEDA